VVLDSSATSVSAVTNLEFFANSVCVSACPTTAETTACYAHDELVLNALVDGVGATCPLAWYKAKGCKTKV
jgi:hypothetical protein